MEVLVVGAGIAGLSFALKATRLGGRVKVLERGGIDRKATYGHSLSIRTDVRGVQALQDLGLLDTLQQMTTPTQGFFIAMMPDTVVLSSDWFLSAGSSTRGLRLMRYDLWKTLLQAAQLAGVEILFEEEVFKCVHTDEGVITVETKSGVHHTRLLIAADGHKSIIRSSLLPEQQLNFLGTVIVGCTLSPVVAVPEFIRNHHGLICAPLSVNGSPSSMFVADEGSERLLVSLAFPSYVPVPRDAVTSSASFRESLAALVKYYPKPYLEWVEKMIASSDAFAVSCYDKMPHQQQLSNVVFIGDSWHPVSPFAGAGANMALADGVSLAQILFGTHTTETNVSQAIAQFHKESVRQWEGVVSGQRSMIQWMHAKRGVWLAVRNGLFFTIPWFANPIKRKQLGIAVLVMLAVGAGWWWWR